jgi:hypothetical protein
MVVGFAALIAYDTVLIVSSKSKSADFIKSALRMSAPAGLAGKIIVILGILSGLHLAAKFGFGATWLIGSYVLVAIAIILGAAVLDPIRKRLLVAATEGDARVAAFHLGSVPIAVMYINTLCWAAVIWLMLAKP